jgi:predicted  nucleic acid-binding Zn-ribbon protein
VIEKAIKYCEKCDIMNAYLAAHGSRVMNMLLTEWDFEEEKRIAIEEAIEDLADRIEKAKDREINSVRNFKALGVDVETISKALGLYVEEIARL